MHSYLSKKEKKKKKKLTQARKRDINWPAQQQTLSKLRNTTSNSQKPAQSSKTTEPKTTRETSLKPSETPDISFYTPISLSDEKTSTIQAIQQTLLGLQDKKSH